MGEEGAMGEEIVLSFYKYIYMHIYRIQFFNGAALKLQLIVCELFRVILNSLGYSRCGGERFLIPVSIP